MTTVDETDECGQPYDVAWAGDFSAECEFKRDAESISSANSLSFDIDAGVRSLGDV